MSQSRVEFLKGRQAGIGSSDVAPILGLSPWGSAYSVYVEKIQPVKAATTAMAPQLEWGIRAEPMIAGAIMDHYGWNLTKPPTITHAEFPYLLASGDRDNQDGEPCEIKFTDNNFKKQWGEPETDDIAPIYFPQIQHQLCVRESKGLFADFSWVFVLIGQSDFRRYRVPRDPEYLETVIEPLTEFWECVEARIPPTPDWAHKSTIDAMLALHEPNDGERANLADEYCKLLDEHDVLQALEKEVIDERKAIRARLQAALGTATTGVLPDGRQIVNKLIHRKGYTVEPCDFHQLQIRKAKR